MIIQFGIVQHAEKKRYLYFVSKHVVLEARRFHNQL